MPIRKHKDDNDEPTFRVDYEHGNLEIYRQILTYQRVLSIRYFGVSLE